MQYCIEVVREDILVFVPILGGKHLVFYHYD